MMVNASVATVLEVASVLATGGPMTTATSVTATTTAVATLDKDMSPVTLASDWSRVARLLILASLSVIGSVGNVFMISAVMIEDHLKKRGNAFVVNVALADLLITGLVFPASVVVLLAGLTDDAGQATVCAFQWLLAVLCSLVTVLTLTGVAAENFARLCLPAECYDRLTAAKITVIILLLWALGGSVVAVQTALELGPDYCHRRFPGVMPYMTTVAVFLVGVPTVITLTLYAKIMARIRDVKTQPTFKPPTAFSWDYSLMKTNMYSFLLFVVFWLPFGVVVSMGSLPRVSARLFYNLAWLALSKSCFNNLLYCVTNRHFRHAYINLFHYCFCKTTVTFSRRPRAETSRPSGDVRVHIIPGYNMYSYTSPQRGRELCVGGGGGGGGVSAGGLKPAKRAAGARSAGARSAGTRAGAASRGASASRDVYQL